MLHPSSFRERRSREPIEIRLQFFGKRLCCLRGKTYVPKSIKTTLMADGSVSFCSGLRVSGPGISGIVKLIFNKASMTYFAQTLTHQPISCLPFAPSRTEVRRFKWHRTRLKKISEVRILRHLGEAGRIPERADAKALVAWPRNHKKWRSRRRVPRDESSTSGSMLDIAKSHFTISSVHGERAILLSFGWRTWLGWSSEREYGVGQEDQ